MYFSSFLIRLGVFRVQNYLGILLRHQSALRSLRKLAAALLRLYKPKSLYRQDNNCNGAYYLIIFSQNNPAIARIRYTNQTISLAFGRINMPAGITE